MTTRPVARMLRSLRSPSKLAPAVAAVLLAAGAPVAQAQPGGVPEALSQVSQTLNALIATVSQLSAQISQLTTAIATPPPASNALITSMLSVTTTQRVECRVSNSGAATAQVTVQVFDNFGSFGAPVALTLAPGTTQVVRASVLGDSFIYRACRFTAANVPVSQLRATAAVLGPGLEMFVLSEAR